MAVLGSLQQASALWYGCWLSTDAKILHIIRFSLVNGPDVAHGLVFVPTAVCDLYLAYDLSSL